MYGLPADVDLSFFKGATLSQICIGSNQMIFNFESPVAFGPSISLNVQTAFSISQGDLTEIFEAPPQAASAASALIAHVVVEETHTVEGALTLEFDNRSSLILCDDSEEYESYEIAHNGNLIVV